MNGTVPRSVGFIEALHGLVESREQRSKHTREEMRDQRRAQRREHEKKTSRLLGFAWRI
jgi:hypothetical protein